MQILFSVHTTCTSHLFLESCVFQVHVSLSSYHSELVPHQQFNAIAVLCINPCIYSTYILFRILYYVVRVFLHAFSLKAYDISPPPLTFSPPPCLPPTSLPLWRLLLWTPWALFSVGPKRLMRAPALDMRSVSPHTHTQETGWQTQWSLIHHHRRGRL